MQKANKGFISIIILVVITLAILGGGAYYLTTTHGTETLTPLEEITLDPDRPMLRDRTHDTISTQSPNQSQSSHIAQNTSPLVRSIPNAVPSTPTLSQHTSPTTPTITTPTTPTPQSTNPTIPTPQPTPTSGTPPSVNVAPVINSVSVNPVTIGQVIQFTITASDSNGDTLTYSSGTLPQGATFNPLSHIFTWTPTTAGTYTVAFKVSDGRLESTISVQMIATRQARPPIVDQNPSLRSTIIPTQGSDFKIIDAVSRYPGKLFPLTMIPQAIPGTASWGPSFFDNYITVPNPSEAATRAYARSLPQGVYAAIDIEDWPISISTSTKAEVDVTIQKFKNIISWMKSERPDLHVGLYGEVPFTNYYDTATYRLGVDGLNRLAAGEPAIYNDPNDPRSLDTWYRGAIASPTGDPADATSWKIDPTKEATIKYLTWQADNDYLAPLAQSVDFIAPEIYTYESNVDTWNAFAKEMIKKAQQYGKPVYPFIWPKYFDHQPGDADAQRIPRSYFRDELDVVKNSGAQGVFIWDDAGDYDADGPWREFPWVTELRDFVQDNNIGSNNLNAAALNAITMHEEEFWLSLYITIIALLGLYIELRWYLGRKNQHEKSQ